MVLKSSFADSEAPGIASDEAAIAQKLEARGVRTPAGRDRWDAKQVSRLLTVSSGLGGDSAPQALTSYATIAATPRAARQVTYRRFTKSGGKKAL
jgi:hypothetical protein